MAVVTSEKQSKIQELVAALLSSLEETSFFSELSRYIWEETAEEKVLVYKIVENDLSVLVAENGQGIQGGQEIKGGEGVGGYVLETKRAYYSNSLKRDPLYNENYYSPEIVAELCVPIMIEGKVLATIHFQTSQANRNYSQVDVDYILGLLGELSIPLKNMQLYLSAKHLNESLLKKIENSEREVLKRKVSEHSYDFEFTKIEEKELTGKSGPFIKMMDIVRKVAPTDANVLISGGAGVGKDLLAHKIHCLSDRRNGPYIIFNCAIFNETMCDNEKLLTLDGPGPLTKAFMDANGGTLYLDNIHCLDPHVQTKLLRFFQSDEVCPVNDDEGVKLDVRVISSTSKDLQKEVMNGSFLQDLFFRLHTINIEVPSLTQRKDDILLLSEDYLNRTSGQGERRTLTMGAKKVLTSYDWPGNIRELGSVMKSALILVGNEKVIDESHLPDNIKKEGQQDLTLHMDSDMTLEALEKKHICLILDRLRGNKTRTAKVLGITVKTLYNKLHSYGMIPKKENISMHPASN